MEILSQCVFCFLSFIVVKGESPWHKESVGCFYDDGNDNRALPHQGFGTKNVPELTIGKCINACRGKGYRFAGVEYYKQCYCGDVFPRLGLASSNGRACNTPCDGNKDENCGGGNALSVYTVCKNETHGQVDSISYNDYTCPNTCGNCASDFPPCHQATGKCEGGCKDRHTGDKCDVCIEGRYGSDCISQCGNCVNPTCDKNTGHCDNNGCKVGYKGDKCDTECDPGMYGRNCAWPCGQCVGVCSSTNGECPGDCKAGWIGKKCDRECDVGKYGDGCEQTCGSCKNQTCNNTNGVCPNQECEIGWEGDLCKQKCRNGIYGENCGEVCGHCQGDTCDHISGTCNSGTCLAGWQGDKCKEPCEDGTFGLNCSNVCGNCKSQPCAKVTGECPDTKCKPGWTGAQCKTECMNGTFGSGCINCGKCVALTCDRFNGSCDSRGCLAGWKGSTCLEACQDGTFGKRCEQKCGLCENEPCDKVTGKCSNGKCKSGWQAPNCTVASPESKSISIGMIAGIAAGAVLLIILIPVIIIIVRKRRGAGKDDVIIKENNASGERSLYGNVNPAGPEIESKDSKYEKAVPTDIERKTTYSKLKPTSKKNKVPPPVSVVKPIVKPAIQPKPKKPEVDPKHSKEPAPTSSEAGEGANDSPIYGNQATIPIKLKDLDKYILKKHSEEDGFFKEFQSIPSGKLRDWKVATAPANSKLKNRFKNVYAYDHSRVHLNTLPNDPHSDYINASYIKGYRGKKFIATQGPKKTGGDLWRMVWEQKVTRIVMVTNLNEGGAEKCDKYWPNEKEEITLGHFTVTNQKEENFPGYVLRTFKLSEVKDESSLYGNIEGGHRTVLHFHYTDWPDKDVPINGYVMVNFLRKVRAFSANVREPIVVHCSAGVGRTGTFLALDYLTDQAAAEGIVDIYKCVTEMREDRVNMVQTPSQYVFIYEAISEALAVGETMIPGHAFSNTLIELQKTEKGKTCPRMETQFKMLMKFSEKVLKEEEFTKANLPENQPKNRTQSNLPSDNVCPLLMTVVTDRNNYINAAFVDGYGKKSSHLITQLPLEDTVVDFWRLVYDYNVNTIVMLTNYQSKEFKSFPYCPLEDVDDLEIEPFVIKRQKVALSSDLLTATVNLSIGTKTKEILVVCPTKWPKDVWKPDKISTFEEIYNKVQEWKKVNNPMARTIIQCFDGGMNSSMYAIVSCMFDMIQAEQGVDIYQTTKQILQARLQSLTNVDQYKDLHYIANDHLQKVSTYANM